MTEDRAIEIIASHGADAARWPDDERAALLALAGTPAVAAALAEAAALDTLLVGWARADVAGAPFDSAGLVPAPALPAARPLRRWLAAGAMAAAVAAAVVLAPMRSTPSLPATQVAVVSPVPSATVEGDAGSDAEFAYVFTPTVDEDTLI